MSMTAFAQAIGVSHSSVSLWLDGKRVPTPRSIDKIADVLGADLDTLLTIAGHRPQALDDDPDSPEAILSAMVRRVAWDAGRYELVETMLRTFLEQDRRAREQQEQEA